MHIYPNNSGLLLKKVLNFRGGIAGKQNLYIVPSFLLINPVAA